MSEDFAQIAVFLNVASRGEATPEDMNRFWSAAPPELRARTLEHLVVFVQQSHPLAADVEEAFERCKQSDRLTPWVMLRASQASSQIERVGKLPAAFGQQDEAFIALLALLRVADDRRIASSDECREGRCQHWWHRLQRPK